MEGTTTSPTEPEIVLRLRAAGCVFAEEEARLLVEAAATAPELDAMVERRVGGLPLEHVLGWAEFCGRRWVVAPGVFVPRRRTEFLVDAALARTRPDAVVLDLCCGSGAVGGAVAAGLVVRGGVQSRGGDPVRGGVQSRGDDPAPRVHAADLDPAAAACARRNLPGHSVYEGDLYAPLPDALRGVVDLIVVVAPYVPSEAVRFMPPEARTHEPLVALDGGRDGLDVVRRVLAGAPEWLAGGGSVLLETGEDQAPAAVGAAERAGLVAEVLQDTDDGATVVAARRPVMIGVFGT